LSSIPTIENRQESAKAAVTTGESKAGTEPTDLLVRLKIEAYRPLCSDFPETSMCINAGVALEVEATEIEKLSTVQYY
jgi:hypothetical protein